MQCRATAIQQAHRDIAERLATRSAAPVRDRRALIRDARCPPVDTDCPDPDSRSRPTLHALSPPIDRTTARVTTAGPDPPPPQTGAAMDRRIESPRAVATAKRLALILAGVAALVVALLGWRLIPSSGLDRRRLCRHRDRRGRQRALPRLSAGARDRRARGDDLRRRRLGGPGRLSGVRSRETD